MKWTNNKPTKIGIYLMSNPIVQKDLRFKRVVIVDGELMTFHPDNEGSKLILVKDMPKRFVWTVEPITLPDHYKKDFWDKPEDKR